MVTMTNKSQLDIGVDLPRTELSEEQMGSVSRELLDELLELIPLAGAEKASLTVRTPLTDEKLADYPRCTAATVAKAVRRARRAQVEWVEKSLSERAAVFLRYHDLILERREEILDLIQLETGKARKNAFEEVADVAMVARYYALNAERHIGPRRRKGALPGLTSTWEYRHPLGVVGFITPWNYPLSLGVTDAIPALMAGNGVVLKPDQQTPFTALWAVRLLQEAGLPLDLFQVVTGKGKELGTPLIDAVDFITFTGSTRTGRIIARQAGERLIGCSLELGGKNAMIVLADADLEAAVDGAIRGSFSNTGQLCISIERLYVHESIFERFLSRFVARTARLELDAELDFDADVGSLVSRQQLEKVSAHVADAVEKGAEVLVGGRARPEIGPFFYEPTVLHGVTDEMLLCAEETFGPLVSVYSFRSAEEAIERANASRYGLNASIWSEDTHRARQLATRIEAGTVNVNEAYAATWASVDAPMGGFKDSGLGRRHGAEGILKYTEPQTVSVQRGLPLAAPSGVDEENYSDLMSGALRILRWIPGLR
jgi:succinate-semialdehyde dehydrogenase/glutarate-semialdehyde dehydrogenase